MKTGEVRRQCLFAQSNDHPRVNPSFYSKPTRYCYVNMCMTDDADISNPPQVGQQLDPLAVTSVPEASNVVPAPASLGKTWQSIPDEVLLTTASFEESDFSWTTRAAANASSVLPTDLPISLPESRHAYAPHDPTPYTEVPLPVGGVPAEPSSPFRQSVLTAKDRLSKLSRLDFSTISMSLDFPWDQQDQMSQSESQEPIPEMFSTLSTFASVDSNMEEDEPFPVSASKVQGKKAGSTRAMGSLEWLNLCSGPPKANFLTTRPLSLLAIHSICPPSLLSMHCIGPLQASHEPGCVKRQAQPVLHLFLACQTTTFLD